MLLEVFEFVPVCWLLCGERGAVIEERHPSRLGEAAGEAFGGHDPHDGLGLVHDPPRRACLHHRGLAGLRAEDQHEVGNIDIAEALERLAEVGCHPRRKCSRHLRLPLAQDHLVSAPLGDGAPVNRCVDRAQVLA